MSKEAVVLHGKFAPNGAVVELAERPAGLTPQQWFNFLSVQAADAYQTFAGGRIVFTLTRERLDTLKAQSLN